MFGWLKEVSRYSPNQIFLMVFIIKFNYTSFLDSKALAFIHESPVVLGVSYFTISKNQKPISINYSNSIW